jgi:hypothetical protein
MHVNRGLIAAASRGILTARGGRGNATRVRNVLVPELRGPIERNRRPSGRSFGVAGRSDQRGASASWPREFREPALSQRGQPPVSAVPGRVWQARRVPHRCRRFPGAPASGRAPFRQSSWCNRFADRPLGEAYLVGDIRRKSHNGIACHCRCSPRSSSVNSMRHRFSSISQSSRSTSDLDRAGASNCTL